MFANHNNLPESITLCNELEQKANAIQCAEGVFMENFNTNDAFHTTEYKRAEDPFYPCNVQQQPYKAVCTFYVARYYLDLHEHAHADAITWCNTLDTSIQDACIKGVGSAVTKKHIHELAVPNSVCAMAPEQQQHYCFDGIVSYIIVHHASWQKGQEWCNTVTNEHKASCQNIVQESKTFYAQ